MNNDNFVQNIHINSFQYLFYFEKHYIINTSKTKEIYERKMTFGAVTPVLPTPINPSC